MYDEDAPSQTCAGVALTLFQRVCVQLSLDQSNVQHEKLILRLVEPKIEGFSVDAVVEEDEDEAKAMEEEKTKKKKRKSEGGAVNGSAKKKKK